MTIALDPKFAKVVRLMRSTSHEGERASARARADDIAHRCGTTFEEALRLHDAAEAARGAKSKGPNPKSAGPRAYDPADLDDWMEQREPGWKEKKNEKVRAWRARKAAIIARYGSEEAVLAPCPREQLILDAVARWRTVRPAPWGRWTDRLDGWRDALDHGKAPAHVLAAISSAYPLPVTFTEAKAEDDYWRARSDEMEDVLSTDGQFLGNSPLDLPAEMRANMVRDLVETGICVTSLAELRTRFAMFRDADWHDSRIEDALFRDLSAMVDRQEATAAPAHPERGNRSGLAGQIREALAADVRRSDRWIARGLGCSPTTVGAVRREMGLSGTRRTVQRGGQIYEMGQRSRTTERTSP